MRFRAVSPLVSPFPRPLRGLRGGSWVPGQASTWWEMRQGSLRELDPAVGAWGAQPGRCRAGGNGPPGGLGRPLLGEKGSAQSLCLKGAPHTPRSRRKASPSAPILANLGYRDGEVKPPGWGARVGRKQGDPPCTLSPGWPGCREAINWSHSSHNEMEMKPPDRGALSWGRMVASSRAWRGSPRPCPLLCCPPKPPRQGHRGHAAEGGCGPPCPASRPSSASE